MAKSTTPISARLDEEADRHIRQVASERNVKPSQVIQEMYQAWAYPTKESEPEPAAPEPQPDNNKFFENSIILPDYLEDDYQRKQERGKVSDRHTYLERLYHYAKKWFYKNG